MSPGCRRGLFRYAGKTICVFACATSFVALFGGKSVLAQICLEAGKCLHVENFCQTKAVGNQETNSAEYIADAAPSAKPKNPHTFFRRLATAWTASALVVVGLYLVFIYNDTHAGMFSIPPRDALFFWLSLSFATAGIFLIAWPMETWVIGPKTRTHKAVLAYALAIIGLAVLFAVSAYLPYLIKPNADVYGLFNIYVIATMGIVALIVACIGRAIYPLLLKRPIVTGLLALAVFGLLTYTLWPIR